MKRMLIAAAAILTLTASGATRAGASAPRAHLQSFSCQHAVQPLDRGVSVLAMMRPLSGTQRMQMRFELLSKSKSSPSYRAVAGGDLGTWLSPSNPPTLGQRPSDVWKVVKSVADLAAPASYHFRVTFRWIGLHDRVLSTTARVSPTCVQPELRPDLAVLSIDVQPIQNYPNLNRYVATIRNAGATAAGPFRVQFTPGGGLMPKYHSVPSLASHVSIQVAFTGPACNLTAGTVTADPDLAVDDFDRSNNTMTAACSNVPGQP